MKVYAHNSHGADDHTEAMFCAIEREKGILKVPMVQAVSELARQEYMRDSQMPRSGAPYGRDERARCFVCTIKCRLKRCER
jgi:hypothetical protein